MKSPYRNKKITFVIAVLLTLVLITHDGIWPFMETGALNAQTVSADDFGTDGAVYIGDETTPDQPDTAPQTQPESRETYSADTAVVPEEETPVLSESAVQGSAQKTPDQKELLISDSTNGISVLYSDDAGIPEDALLTFRKLEQKEMTEELDRAVKALNWEDSELLYSQIYDFVISDNNNANITYLPRVPVTIEVRFYDKAVMSQEQQRQFIAESQQLLDPNRTYTDLDQQFTELRQNYIRQMKLSEIQVVRLGQTDETLETTLDDGVLRFKTDKIAPFIFLIEDNGEEDIIESDGDFFDGDFAEITWPEDEPDEGSVNEPETENGEVFEGAEAALEAESEEAPAVLDENEAELSAPVQNGGEEVPVSVYDSESVPADETDGNKDPGVEWSTNEADIMQEPVTEEILPETVEAADETEGSGLLVSSGDQYEISLSYDPEANIPQGSELVVEELSEASEQYDEWNEKLADVLGTEAENILSVKLVNLSIDKDGAEVEPESTVDVSVQLAGQTDNQAVETQLIALGNAPEVLDAEEENKEIVNYEISGQTLDTVYAIVRKNITRELLASDGRTYEISASFQSDAEIPAGVELFVSEIRESDADYGEYVEKSAERLGETAETLLLARAFDISLKNPETGVEYQPSGDVQVSIQLLNDDLDNYAFVDVVHIPDGAGEDIQVMDATVHGEAVEFTTDGFSVYVLAGSNGKVGIPQCTFTFYVEDNDLYKEYSFTDSQGKPVYRQIITDRSELVVPQLTSTEEKVFDGWYEGSMVGGQLTLSPEPYDFGSITISENSAVYLYAVYRKFATVVFHGQYDGTSKVFPVAYTRRAELVDTEEESGTEPSAAVKIDDLSTAYTGNGGANMAFFGWSEIPITIPGASKDDNGNNVAVLSTDEDGCITVTGEKNLYPVFKTVHRLTFYSAQSGKGADYVPAANYFAGDALPIPLPVTSMDGYTFQGWYTGTLVKNGTEETVNYGSQITKADGTLVASADDSGIYIDAGKLFLRTDVTLYAKWAANTETSYKIIIWTQDPSDTEDLENSDKTYIYAESEIRYGEIGTVASVSQEYIEKSYQGYAYSRCDGAKAIEADGSTVLNVYYDKEGEYTPSGSYKLSFVDSVSEEGKISEDLPVEYDSISYKESITDKIPADPISGRNGYEFSDWYFDPACTIPADLSTMPDHDLTVYAGWETGWYVVTLDPNYGALYGEEGESGTGSTWFWSSFEGEPIGEYTHVTRNYEESSSGTWYYVDHSGDGHGGDNGWPDRYTYYTQDPSKATEDTTFEYAPGTYTYIGWYEVYLDESGNEIGEASEPYDFSQHVDHDTKLRLHWKKAGTYYLAFDAGEGTLEDDTKNVVLPDGYADHANVTVTHAATAPDGYTFAGWKVRGSDSNTIYTTGQTFTMHADDTYRVGGKDIVYLDAVYVRVGTAGIIYDANGGTLTEGSVVDFGKIPGSTADTWEDASGIIDAAEGTAAVSGLTNNTKFKLSDGTGFSAPQGTDAIFLGWSDKTVCDNSAVFYSKDSTDTYAVNTAEPVKLYAVWGVQATYALNSGDAQWGEDWDSTVYKQEDNVYTQTVDLGNTILEPANAPVYTGADGRLFRYWATRSGAGTTEASYVYTEYDFSQPVRGALDLYAFWSEPNTIRVHAVDASDETLLDKTGQDEWTVQDITVSTAETELDVSSGYVEAPEGYDFAFVAVSEDVDTISEDHAVSAVKYDSSKKNVVVKYDGDTEFTKLKNGEELYFVYYQQKALEIQYKSMGADDVLQNADVTKEAPRTTADEPLGSYNMTEGISQPLSWAGGIYTHYAFAIGDADADTANSLSLLTAASSSEEDGSRPMLQIRNTWRGFEYTTDGSAWIDCSHAPALYVIYYTQQPTVVMFDEKTIGTAAVMDTEFTYNYVITETKTTTVSKEGEEDQITTETNTVNNGTSCQLKTGEADSMILFYNETESVDENTGSTTKVVTAQTVTITQTEKELFDTTVKGDEIEKSETLSCTYTADRTGGTKKVTFTNIHRSLPVEIHVAMVENDGETGGIIQRDGIYRNTSETSYKFDLAINESEDLLTKLQADAVFKGDTSTYALGAVAYGTGSEGSVVTFANMGVASVSYAQIKDDIYELVLKDEKGKILDELGNDQIYYLYYPMPRIRYVKEAEDGKLIPVTGSLPNEQTGTIEVSGSITYNHDTLTMNGRTVAQDQSFEIPLEGFVISQSGNNFRMPPVLDDSLYERYLGYVKIGVGSNDASDSAELDVSDGLTLQIKVQNNTLQYSFDGMTWTDLSLYGTPTVYAIYAERGYDLQISKTVDMSRSGENALFSGSSFAVTITSSAITKDSYDAEGAENSTIAATPARGSTPGRISFTAMDGTKIRIKGLGQGDYTITESGNENYVLTVKSGSIVGSSTSAMEVSDNTTVRLTLDTETKVDLTNSPRAICRIGDHYFYTLRSMVEYVDETITTKTAEAEMLTDYLMPAADTVEIPNGCDITLTTADSLGHVAVITRTSDLADVPLFTNNGALTLTSLTLEGNSIDATAPMIQSAGNVTIGEGAELRNAVNGGAIHASAGDITIGGTIKNCSTAEGGAIHHVGNGTITLEGTGRLRGNTATSGNGGAIYVSSGTIRIRGNSEISGNTASENGGAIFVGNAVVEVDQGGSITENTAKEGGAIYAETGTITISETENLPVKPSVSENTATAGNGGAIWIGAGSVTVSDGSVSDNKAENGNGGAIYANTASVTISVEAEVKNNNAQAGGAVYANSGAVVVSGGTVESNTALTGNGGAIYAGSGNVTVSGGSMSQNTAVEGNGGAIYADRGSVILSGESASISDNTAKTDGGAIYANRGTVTVSLETISGNTATDGKGGAIYAGSGAVSITGTALTKNNAGTEGGAVYAETGAVSATNAVFGAEEDNSGNTAGENGGAIYAGSGNVTVSGGSMSQNTAVKGNGGAVYVGNGALTVSNSLIVTDNEAGQEGGAVYAGSGTSTLTSVIATGNKAVNGAAVFTNTGRTTFSAGSYTENIATTGGAIGVGSKDARLYFTGNVTVKHNTLGEGEEAPESNLYLNQDDDAVINIDTLDSSASIGIYVPDDPDNAKTLVDNRSVPGARFAIYTNNGNVSKIVNDRFPTLSVQSDTAAKKLYWGNAIKVEVRYLSSFSSGFPPVTEGDIKYTNNSYFPEFNDGAISELATELFTKYSLGLTATAVYGVSFQDGASAFDEYVTRIIWNIDDAKWQLTKRDGTTVDLDDKKIIIYYAEPAYISIENNTDMKLTISDLMVKDTSVINSDTVAGYGTVFAKNGAIRTALLPVEAEDLSLLAGASINLLIPGGRNMPYALEGSFETDVAQSIRVRRGSASGSLSEETVTVTPEGYFPDLKGNTLNGNGTYQIIFGNDKVICKVVDADGNEHPYGTLGAALVDIKKTESTDPPYELKEKKTATIEMVTDYLLPASDSWNSNSKKGTIIPQGYNITLTTAKKDESKYPYIGEGDRAIISRDSENTYSMLTTETGNVESYLTLKDLIFDGKSVRGSSDGGAVSATYFGVKAENVDFINIYAGNGGALYVNDKDNNAQNKENSIVEVVNCRFVNCNSTKATGSRLGGGAIHAYSNTLNMTDCIFDSCKASDQAGAVFHRVEGDYESWTNISRCTFTNCQAKAAGGLELDSKTINMVDSVFEHCIATERNGGGFNVYALNNATPTSDCWVTVSGCIFNDCQLSTTNTSNGNGGGFRSNAVYTKVENSTFTNNVALFGGGFCISNGNAKKGEVYGCTFERNTASQGGGIYGKPLELIIGDHTYVDEAGIEYVRHTEVKNCTSNNEGGGVYQTRNADASSLTITNAEISGNQTRNNKDGGGIWTNARTVKIEGTSITENKATNRGGGVFVHTNVALTKESPITIEDSEISRNTSNGNGAGVWYDNENTNGTYRNYLSMYVKGSSIDDNTSGGSGGGIYTCAKTVTIGDSEIKTDSEAKAISSSVSGNTAKNGGGIYHSRNADGSNLTITNASINGNTANTSETNAERGGGAIFASVRTLDITASEISRNSSIRQGGGIYFDINNNDSARQDMKLILKGCTLDTNTSGTNGGAVFTAAYNVEITSDTREEDGEAVAFATTISKCTAASSGGGLYHNQNGVGSALTIRDTYITGCSANDSATNNAEHGGGGVYANVRTTIIDNSEISGNSAVRNGGGILALSSGNDRYLTIDHSIITGNTSGNQGGAIYTRSMLTLRNKTEITGNRLSTNTVSNAAGVYIENNRRLFVGIEDASYDTVTVKENYASDGTASNLRLWENGTANNQPNNPDSVYVYCNLNGEIRVVNAKTVGAQFGSSEIAKPDGFTDDFSVFKADTSTLHGIIDRNDPDGKKIIWAGPPIAKITDGEGNLLYLRGGEKGTDPAIFDRLGTGNTNNNDYSSIAAFNMLLTTDIPELYSSDGTLYTGSDYIIKMLDSFVTSAHMNVTYVEGRTIKLTTASRNDTDGYPFIGSGTRATIIRGAVNAGQSTLNAKGNLILENIILDAGTTSGVEVGVNSRCIWIDNANCTVTLGENSILQNGHVNTSNDGGGVNIQNGTFIIRGGVIRNCTARDGGGVYNRSSQEMSIEAGNIYQCIATRNGGGVYNSGLSNKGGINMSGGTISGGSAVQGGGVYVVSNTGIPFNMSGGSIINNTATSAGGGIAIGGANSRLYFSGRVNISGNTCDASLAPNKASNVELNQDRPTVNSNSTVNANGIINTNNGGLLPGSYIGVYVPDGATLYNKHGIERTPFGTFATNDNTSTFYSFVNDRNGLKGGIIENPSPNTIYWIQIFSLKVSKEVEAGNSTSYDPDEQFLFKVNIRGEATVSGQLNAKDIDSRGGEYGEMEFASNGSDTTTAIFALKAGESVTGVNLSEGLNYEVIEYLTEDQFKRYAAMPMNGYSTVTETLDGTTYTVIKANVYSSEIGENKSRTDIDPYTSAVEFKNLLPICKVTDNNGKLLYQRYTWNEKVFYAPAVYTELTGDSGAFKALNETLYTSNGSNPTSYSVSNGVQIQMLISEYTLDKTAEADTSKVTLTTASASDALFPKQDAGTTSTIRRAFVDGSMLDVEGDLTLETIILDGAKSSYTANADGGIAKVANGGKLTIVDGATLQKSKTAEEYKGGAVYVEAGGTVTMSGGTINHNESADNGAGIYLMEGSILNLSGTPSFGGTGLNVSENITTTNGNFKIGDLIAQTNGGKNYARARQDIFIAESQDNPASVVLTGNLDVDAGSIWVWAEMENHYAMMKPFAIIQSGTINGATYAAFRNAQPDSMTNCGEDNYLSGSSGENVMFIYWAGGFDVSFEKINSFGTSMSGAAFTLYTDLSCTEAVKQGGEDATAVSADGTETYKDKTGTTLDAGIVLFEQIPAGVYYMKESSVPDGYVNALTNDDLGKPVSNVYVVLVGDGAMQGFGTGVLEDITQEQITAQTGTDDDKKDAAIFLIDPVTQKAVASPDITRYGIMNVSTAERKVILKKVNSTYTPLEGAVFEVLRYDRTQVSGTDINGNTTTTFTSGASGVYFIEMLPYGTYYLHETQNAKKEPVDLWFTLTVNETGVGYQTDDSTIINRLSPETQDEQEPKQEG